MLLAAGGTARVYRLQMPDQGCGWLGGRRTLAGLRLEVACRTRSTWVEDGEVSGAGVPAGQQRHAGLLAVS